MTHMNRITACLLCISFAAGQLRAQDGNAFSLQQSIEYGIKNSPSSLNADLDLKNAEYRKDEITGIGLPQISGSADLKDYISLPTSLIPGDFVGKPGTYIPVKFGTKYNATLGLSASQIIFNSDYIFGLKASREFLNLSKISITRTRAEMAAQISKAYYNVVINRDRLKLLDANIARLKKLYEDTKVMNEQGLVEVIDVERLQVQYNNLLTEQQKAGQLIGLAETMLKFQMGYKLSEPIVLTDSIAPLNGDFQPLMNGTPDISMRPDYKLLMAQQALNELDVKRLKYGYMPTLAAYGSYQYNAQRNAFTFLSFDKNDPLKRWFKIGLVGVTLNVSIFDGLQRNYKIQQAKITSQKNLNNIRNLQLAGELEATSANINYSNAYATVSIQKKNLELAQHVYDVTQKKYNAGVGPNIEIVNAEISLIEAQTNYYNALYDMVVARIDYQKATGTLIK